MSEGTRQESHRADTPQPAEPGVPTGADIPPGGHPATAGQTASPDGDAATADVGVPVAYRVDGPLLIVQRGPRVDQVDVSLFQGARTENGRRAAEVALGLRLRGIGVTAEQADAMVALVAGRLV